jgi:hypothetical protein
MVCALRASSDPSPCLGQNEGVFTRIRLIRHASTDRRGRWRGSFDVPLNRTGVVGDEESMNVFNRTWCSRIGLGLLGAFPAIQVVPYGRDHINPAITGEPTWNAMETRALAKRACFDCHSHETEWPANASIAPVSWRVQRDVNEGRAVLNCSDWTRPEQEAAFREPWR